MPTRLLVIKPPLRRLMVGWTIALALGVVVNLRVLPWPMVGLLLPYLAMVAWWLVVSPSRPQPVPAISVPEPVAPPEPEPIPEPDPSPVVIRPPVSRPRRKTRPKTTSEPPPAAWVEVSPGRFVREAISEVIEDPISALSTSDSDVSNRSESTDQIDPDDLTQVLGASMFRQGIAPEMTSDQLAGGP